MQDNQVLSGVLQDVTIGHKSILLRMVEHSKHATTAELLRGITAITGVKLMLLLKFYNNLNNREAHYKTQSHQTT